MKHIFISLLSLLAVCAYGQVNSKALFEGSQINGLVVNGAFEVKLSQGDKTGVKITAKSNMLDKVSVTISENGILNLKYGSEVGKYFKSDKPLVEVVVSQLDMLTIGGTVGVIGTGEFTSDKTCAIEVNGTAFLEFIKIKAPSVFVTGLTAAKISEITVNTNTLTAVNNGAAVMMLRGECDKFIVSTSATSSLNALLLNAKEIDASCFGMSLVKAMVNGTADVKTGGTAAFKYMGDGTVTGKASKL